MKGINIFFSYYNKDEYIYEKLRINLEERGNFKIRVAEIPDNEAENEEYIKQLIRPKIQWASVVVVIIGPRTYTREWVNWEIEFASNQNKRIVGVYQHGEASSKLPRNLRELHNTGYEKLALVRGNTESIIAAIRGEDRWDEGPAKSSGGCFIATAAYGTPMAYEICILKNLRDNTLSNYRVGLWLIKKYYKISPRIADMINKSNIKQMIIRQILRPLIIIRVLNEPDAKLIFIYD